MGSNPTQPDPTSIGIPVIENALRSEEGKSRGLSELGPPGINLPKIDLSGLGLSGIGLPGIALPEAGLPGVGLSGIGLQGSVNRTRSKELGVLGGYHAVNQITCRRMTVLPNAGRGMRRSQLPNLS